MSVIGVDAPRSRSAGLSRGTGVLLAFHDQTLEAPSCKVHFPRGSAPCGGSTENEVWDGRRQVEQYESVPSGRGRARLHMWLISGTFQ